MLFVFVMIVVVGVVDCPSHKIMPIPALIDGAQLSDIDHFVAASPCLVFGHSKDWFDDACMGISIQCINLLPIFFMLVF